MGGPNRSRVKRITAGITGLMLLILVLFSAFYIAAEADHDCCGEDCPVCTCIQLCENTLHGFAAAASAPLPSVIPIFLALFSAALFAALVLQETLVSRKVRLNN